MTRVNTLKDIEAIYLESVQSINEGGGDPGSVLFACPFCGQDDLLSHGRDGDSWEGNTYYVRCIECDVRMMGKTEQDAMRKWNFRANVEDSNE